jgi:hypothetical protein
MSPGNSVENLGSGYEMREALGYVSNCCNDRLAAHVLRPIVHQRTTFFEFFSPLIGGRWGALGGKARALPT